MKILLISDIEGKEVTINQEYFNGIDMILLAGDLTMGTKSLKRAAREFSLLGSSFPSSLPVFLIPGNHDQNFISKEQDFYPQNFKQMHENYKIFSVDGFKKKIAILGFGGASLGLYNMFAFKESEIEDRLEQLFQKFLIDYERDDYYLILFVHDAPYNTKLDKTHQKTHVGSRSIRKIVEKYQPDLLVCGHIHESNALDYIGNTALVNAGDWNFNKRYAILSISIDETNQSSKIGVDFISKKD